MPEGLFCPECKSPKVHCKSRGSYSKKFCGIIAASLRRDCQNCGHSYFTVELPRTVLESVIAKGEIGEQYDAIILRAAKERLGKLTD